MELVIQTRSRSKKRRTRSSNGESCWQDLDADILRKIFELLSCQDLLLSLSLVCRWWRLVSWDVLFWKDAETLDLTNVSDLLGDRPPVFRRPGWFLRILGLVMCPIGQEDKLRLLKEIVLFPYPYFENEHLIFISQRSPSLRKVSIPASCRITGPGIEKAVENWRELEEISLGKALNYGLLKAIETMGRSCKNLTTLHITAQLNRMYIIFFILDDRYSQAIAKNLQKLKVLGLKDVVLYKTGVSTILRECKELVEIHFNQCCTVEDMSGFKLQAITAKVKKYQTEDFVGWSVNDSKDALVSSEELVDCMWA